VPEERTQRLHLLKHFIGLVKCCIFVFNLLVQFPECKAQVRPGKILVNSNVLLKKIVLVPSIGQYAVPKRH
jgi:hypothetical protein